MTFILLAGAGFSRNWGGLLASEVFDSLLGRPEIHGNQYLRGLLWAHRNSGGFENAVAELQRLYVQNAAQHTENLQILQNAILTVFGAMNNAFLDMPGMEFQQFQERMLRTMLVRFDAIFTLNQDVLLEHHYTPQVPLAAPGRWNGAQLPGLRRIPNQAYLGQSSWARDSWVPLNPAEFRVEQHLQPIFKLHGSTNWRNEQGGNLLVIGGEKSRHIQAQRVLSWSYEIFVHYISQPNTKLMVIGYGFRDQHINRPIIDAVNNHGLQFFVVDALGADVARHANPSHGGAIYAPNELDDSFRHGLVGVSQRRLSETFGGDQVSHGNVMSFFQ